MNIQSLTTEQLKLLQYEDLKIVSRVKLQFVLYVYLIYFNSALAHNSSTKGVIHKGRQHQRERGLPNADATLFLPVKGQNMRTQGVKNGKILRTSFMDGH